MGIHNDYYSDQCKWNGVFQLQSQHQYNGEYSCQANGEVVASDGQYKNDGNGGSDQIPVNLLQ